MTAELNSSPSCRRDAPLGLAKLLGSQLLCNIFEVAGYRALRKHQDPGAVARALPDELDRPGQVLLEIPRRTHLDSRHAQKCVRTVGRSRARGSSLHLCGHLATAVRRNPSRNQTVEN